MMAAMCGGCGDGTVRSVSGGGDDNDKTTMMAKQRESYCVWNRDLYFDDYISNITKLEGALLENMAKKGHSTNNVKAAP
ncbi:hypothetical protein Pelo_4913 [Pelomyxa schiedti]|nr:hypothetical protein Pelo_4913 [Pelomyxa schiedti]